MSIITKQSKIELLEQKISALEIVLGSFESYKDETERKLRIKKIANADRNNFILTYLSCDKALLPLLLTQIQAQLLQLNGNVSECLIPPLPNIPSSHGADEDNNLEKVELNKERIVKIHSKSEIVQKDASVDLKLKGSEKGVKSVHCEIIQPENPRVPVSRKGYFAFIKKAFNNHQFRVELVKDSVYFTCKRQYYASVRNNIHSLRQVYELCLQHADDIKTLINEVALLDPAETETTDEKKNVSGTIEEKEIEVENI